MEDEVALVSVAPTQRRKKHKNKKVKEQSLAKVLISWTEKEDEDFLSDAKTKSISIDSKSSSADLDDNSPESSLVDKDDNSTESSLADQVVSSSISKYHFDWYDLRHEAHKIVLVDSSPPIGVDKVKELLAFYKDERNYKYSI